MMEAIMYFYNKTFVSTKYNPMFWNLDGLAAIIVKAKATVCAGSFCTWIYDESIEINESQHIKQNMPCLLAYHFSNSFFAFVPCKILYCARISETSFCLVGFKRRTVT